MPDEPQVNRGSYPGPVRPTERRLAAILFMDMAEYSRMVALDEEGALKRWSDLRSTVIYDIVRDHGGRVVKVIGDELMQEFPSAVKAIACSVSLQQAIDRHNADQPPADRMRFRIGVHIGDVVAEGLDILGDDVNIAARLRALADPGGVVISAATYDQVRGRLDLDFEDVGAVTLKNIPAPVRAYRWKPREVHGAVSVRSPPPSAAGRRPSVAVLPFRTVDGKLNERYLGDGIVEDIIVSLAGLQDLFVINRGSTLAYRDRLADVRQIGGELGARYILSGSLQRTGRRLRVRAELCDVESGNDIWADRFDTSWSEVFDIQDRISESIVSELASHVHKTEIQRVLRKRPEELTAYDATLRALDCLYGLDRDDFLSARSLLEQAQELDPGYSRPYALAAQWHSLWVGQGWSTDADADTIESARLAREAVRRDSRDSLALAIMGHNEAFLNRDCDAAVATFERALRAGPSCAMAWTLSSPTFAYLGNAGEAVRRAERGLRLSPLDAHVYYFRGVLALAHYADGNYRDAIRLGRQAMRARPGFVANLRVLAASLAADGNLTEAREIGTTLRVAQPHFRVEAFCANHPFVDAARKGLLAKHLILAGLPA